MSSKGNTTETDEAVQNLTQTRLMVREQNYLQARASAVADLEEHYRFRTHFRASE